MNKKEAGFICCEGYLATIKSSFLSGFEISTEEIFTDIV